MTEEELKKRCIFYMEQTFEMGIVTQKFQKLQQNNVGLKKVR